MKLDAKSTSLTFCHAQERFCTTNISALPQKLQIPPICVIPKLMVLFVLPNQKKLLTFGNNVVSKIINKRRYLKPSEHVKCLDWPYKMNLLSIYNQRYTGGALCGTSWRTLWDESLCYPEKGIFCYYMLRMPRVQLLRCNGWRSWTNNSLYARVWRKGILYEIHVHGNLSFLNC